MTNKILRIASAALLAGTLAACGTRRPAPAPGPDGLYTRGMELHQAGSHRRAAEVLGQFVQQHAGDPRVPQALLTRGRAHMGAREHVLATADFMRVVTEFGSNPLARDARFALCEAYVALAPRTALDQEYTRAAVAYCDQYATTYTSTTEADRARLHVIEMRSRLAQKVYDNGLFYFRRRWNDAAIVYFNEVVSDYPETPQAPAALMRLYETYGRMRYEEEQAETRTRLLRDYPQSAEARQLAA
jgi:outer membrane protein assembly factor BamD